MWCVVYDCVAGSAFLCNDWWWWLMAVNFRITVGRWSLSANEATTSLCPASYVRCKCDTARSHLLLSAVLRRRYWWAPAPGAAAVDRYLPLSRRSRRGKPAAHRRCDRMIGHTGRQLDRWLDHFNKMFKMFIHHVSKTVNSIAQTDKLDKHKRKYIKKDSNAEYYYYYYYYKSSAHNYLSIQVQILTHICWAVICTNDAA